MKIWIRPASLERGIAGIAALALSTIAISAHSSIWSPSEQMQLGRQSLERHEWSEAIQHFRDVIGVDYHNADAHANLGYAYLYYGNLVAAASEFRTALRLHPHLSNAENGLHLTFKDETDHDAYVQSLRDEVAKEPGNADAHAALAEELLEHGHPGDAQQEADAALRLNPKLGHAQCVLGRIAAQQGNAVAARQSLEFAVKQDVNDDDAWGTLGDLSMQGKDYKEAVADYKHAVHASPENAEWHQKLADADTGMGDTRGAEHEREMLTTLAHLSSNE